MILRQCALAMLLVTLATEQSPAKGGGMRSEDRYNPQHISTLPDDVRSAVLRKCSTPRALHTFASYTDNLRRVVLHFENFYCEQNDSFCRPSGECLHEVYGGAGSHYRLLRTYYARPGD